MTTQEYKDDLEEFKYQLKPRRGRSTSKTTLKLLEHLKKRGCSLDRLGVETPPLYMLEGNAGCMLFQLDDKQEVLIPVETAITRVLSIPEGDNSEETYKRMFLPRPDGWEMP